MTAVPSGEVRTAPLATEVEALRAKAIQQLGNYALWLAGATDAQQLRLAIALLAHVFPASTIPPPSQTALEQ